MQESVSSAREASVRRLLMLLATERLYGTLSYGESWEIMGKKGEGVGTGEGGWGHIAGIGSYKLHQSYHIQNGLHCLHNTIFFLLRLTLWIYTLYMLTD